MQKIEIPSILNTTSFKGMVESKNSLPLQGNNCGDFFVVENTYISYMWDGSEWLRVDPNNVMRTVRMDYPNVEKETSDFESNLKKLEEKTRELQLKEQKLNILIGC